MALALGLDAVVAFLRPELAVLALTFEVALALAFDAASREGVAVAFALAVLAAVGVEVARALTVGVAGPPCPCPSRPEKKNVRSAAGAPCAGSVAMVPSHPNRA